MLSNERHRQIISYLEKKNTVTVQELTDILYASSSTIRRDEIKFFASVLPCYSPKIR